MTTEQAFTVLAEDTLEKIRAYASPQEIADLFEYLFNLDEETLAKDVPIAQVVAKFFMKKLLDVYVLSLPAAT